MSDIFLYPMPEESGTDIILSDPTVPRESTGEITGVAAVTAEAASLTGSGSVAAVSDAPAPVVEGGLAGRWPSVWSTRAVPLLHVTGGGALLAAPAACQALGAVEPPAVIGVAALTSGAATLAATGAVDVSGLDEDEYLIMEAA